MSLKDYIEQNLFSENLLPKFPFLKASWTAHVVDCGGCLEEPDFKLLKMCIDQFTQDASIKYCLTTFYMLEEAPWLSEWETACNYKEFSESIDRDFNVSSVGMYFLGSSEKWGGIILEGEAVIIGSEAEFMAKFEELSGGYAALKKRFYRRYPKEPDNSFFIEFRKTFYPR